MQSPLLVEMWVKQDKKKTHYIHKCSSTCTHIPYAVFFYVGGLFVVLFDLLSNNRIEVTFTVANSNVD